jgi:hypothetical protein
MKMKNNNLLQNCKILHKIKESPSRMGPWDLERKI